MLDYLRIQNLALIEDMELEFSSGLNVLTGETGAGKSFILRALGFLTGDRLSMDLVRPGKEKAVAEAFFALPDGREALLRRELAADTGRSRIFLDAALVSQDRIRELRPALLLHTSQHGQQQLLSPAFQGRMVDAFMDKPALIAEKDRLLKALRELAARREEMEERAAALAEKREMLEFQRQEIETANPLPGEEEELENRREALKNEAEGRKRVEEALALLHGEGGYGGQGGLLRGLERLEHILLAWSREDEHFGPDHAAINELLTGLVDFDARLRRMGTAESADAEREHIEARLYTLAKLKRRLRRSLEGILSLRDEIAENLSFLDSCALDAKRLAREEENLCGKLAGLLAELNPARRDAAARLARALETELLALGFSEHIAVDFAFTPHPLHPARSDCSEDRARLLWRPNPGQPPQPLDKIASGGELSRFLLALAPLLSPKGDEEPALIFDEVDSGVGGLTLNRVAEKLEKLAGSRQIILITHWPQLAAKAGRHFQVRKEVRGGDTFTLCRRLDEDGRRDELARMAGGGDMGKTLAGELMG
jgi:DNA repair protein RecN (Recombination protein N)